MTSGGNVFGGSAVTFSDVLGDKQFNLYAQSISQCRTLSFSYINLSRRFNYAVQAYSQTLFFYGQQANVFYDPVYSPYIDRNLAQATSTIQGGSVFGIYPLNRYRRVELSGGVLQYKQSFNDPTLQDISTTYQEQSFGRQLFQNGTFMPLTASFVEETTIFREFGPLRAGRCGCRMKHRLAWADCSRARRSMRTCGNTRIGTTGLLALRLRGFRSWGDAPDFIYFGGNSELRGYEYLQFLGSRTAFANAELRFPLIEAMLTPLGVLGGIRGVFFAGMGGAYFDGQPFTWWRRGTTTEIPIIGLSAPDRITGLQQPIPGPKLPVSGFRLVDSRASCGLGSRDVPAWLPRSFRLGLEDAPQQRLRGRALLEPSVWQTGDLDGSRNFRKPKFALWIGYDF